jgi:hypothetical protein
MPTSLTVGLMLPPGIDEEADKKRAEQQKSGPQPPKSPEQTGDAGRAASGRSQAQLQAQEAEAEAQLMAQDQAAKQALARDQFEFEAAMALNKHALAEQIAAHGAALKTGQAMHGAGAYRGLSRVTSPSRRNPKETNERRNGRPAGRCRGRSITAPRRSKLLPKRPRNRPPPLRRRPSRMPAKKPKSP